MQAAGCRGSVPDRLVHGSPADQLRCRNSVRRPDSSDHDGARLAEHHAVRRSVKSRCRGSSIRCATTRTLAPAASRQGCGPGPARTNPAQTTLMSKHAARSAPIRSWSERSGQMAQEVRGRDGTIRVASSSTAVIPARFQRGIEAFRPGPSGLVGAANRRVRSASLALDPLRVGRRHERCRSALLDLPRRKISAVPIMPTTEADELDRRQTSPPPRLSMRSDSGSEIAALLDRSARVAEVIIRSGSPPVHRPPSGWFQGDHVRPLRPDLDRPSS